jgi:uncharacterized membrane protein YvbJ
MSSVRKRKSHRKSDGDFRCEKCGRHFASQASVANHAIDMHTPDGQKRRRRMMLGLKGGDDVYE